MSKLQKNIQQYIELMYSEQSELSTIVDLSEKQRTACQRAKLDFDSEEVQKLVLLTDTKFRDQVFEYICSNNSLEYSLTMSDLHLLHNMQRKLIEPLDDADEKSINLRNQMSEKADALLARITTRIQRIFRGKEETKLAMEKMRTQRPQRPEQRLRDKKKP